MNYSLMMPDSTAEMQGAALNAGLTIEDALANGIFQQTTLLAGKKGTSRSIDAIIPAEVPDMSVGLKGGELILTTGSMLRDDGDRWKAWIEELANADAAGVLVLASSHVAMIPHNAIEHAERRGLPLLVMVGWRSVVDVMRPIQEAIETSRAGSVREGLNLQRRLMQMVLSGAGLEAVTKFLATGLNATVVIEDRQFNLLAFAHTGASAEPQLEELIANKGTPVALMKRWEEDGTLKALRKNKQHVVINDAGAQARTIYPIVVGGEVYGFFSLLGHDTLSDHDRLVIENGTTAIAIELLKQKGATESEQKMRRDFFRDLLLANTPAIAETLRRRATYLGFPLNTSYWVLNVEFDEVKNEEQLPENINRLVGILNSLLSFRQAVVVNQAQGATVLYPVKEGQPNGDKIRQLAQAIQHKVAGAAMNSTVSIGVGQLYPELMNVPNAYREAANALKIGRCTNGSASIAFFAELGIYRMLLQFAQTQDPNEFFCEPLQRLIEYNQQTDKELVKTIAAFLECNGNLTETSNKLYIHRNTLKYRLERIRDITQIDLDDAENRLMLHLGLKMNQVLKYLN